MPGNVLQGGGGGGGFGSWRDFDWRDWGKRQGGSFLGSLKSVGQALGAVLLFGLILALGMTSSCLQTSLQQTMLCRPVSKNHAGQQHFRYHHLSAGLLSRSFARAACRWTDSITGSPDPWFRRQQQISGTVPCSVLAGRSSPRARVFDVSINSYTV